MTGPSNDTSDTRGETFLKDSMATAHGGGLERRRCEECPARMTRCQWAIAESLGFLAAGVITILVFVLINQLMDRGSQSFAAMAAMAAIVLTLAYKMASWTKARVSCHFLAGHRRPWE
ncbi:hypothetical protein [Luteolibacter sp. LG18]|uniref:hypothetical protein n=1 Tax=Luteolibacter sp. LG18 TaxID=2819286 RepID=UPI002B2C9338|nr:hypothetical protein llg_41510 [Luteolibacter sp. LG18]